MTVSAWMRAARPAEGGLLVPGRSPSRACDLLLTPEGALLRAADLETRLRYPDYGVAGTEAPGLDVWTLTPWTYTRGGSPIGIAVQGHGGYVEPVARSRARRRPRSGLLDRLAGRSDRAPLDAAAVISTWTDADRDALDVLCRTLARSPEWRPQLGDPARVAQLLHDLAAQDHRAILPRSGVRRRTLETFVVMQKLGYVHTLGGRPLPDERRPDEEVVIAAVLRGLTANRYALAPDEAAVRALVHRHYLDVTPWPFWALVPQVAPDELGLV